MDRSLKEVAEEIDNIWKSGVLQDDDDNGEEDDDEDYDDDDPTYIDDVDWDQEVYY